MKFTKVKMQSGMSYVELIVVLSIFALISSVAIYNYGDFQANVDIKNLASDIASKIVQAQKDSLNGALPFGKATASNWKPSYGVYFDTSTDASKKTFTYFVDLDNNGYNQEPSDNLETISITKNNFIANIDKCSGDSCDPGSSPITSLPIFFRRPDSSAIFGNNVQLSGSEYIKITIASPKGINSFIRIYPSGRVQVR